MFPLSFELIRASFLMAGVRMEGEDFYVARDYVLFRVLTRRLDSRVPFVKRLRVLLLPKMLEVSPVLPSVKGFEQEHDLLVVSPYSVYDDHSSSFLFRHFS